MGISFAYPVAAFVDAARNRVCRSVRSALSPPLQHGYEALDPRSETP